MYKIGEHFVNKNKENLISDPSTVFKGNKYRITVLSERLMRIEYSNDGNFVDCETSLIKNRHFPVPEFKKMEDDRTLILETRYFSLIYSKELSFSSRTLYAKVGGKRIIWYYGLKESKRFDGITPSLDGMNSLPSFIPGLYSLDGYATLNDNGSILFDENSNFIGTNKNIDIYLFVYDINYDLALKDYYTLTGFPSMIPRYALGNWWSKEYSYNEASALKTINKFHKKQIPLSVFILDNYWWEKDKKYPNVKTGYTFNKELFPNPVTFIQEMHKLGIKLGLKINPGVGIFPVEKYFESASKYIAPNKNGYLDFNIYNIQNIDVFLKFFIHPLESLGVDLFWNDYNPCDNNKMYLMNYYMHKDMKRIDKRDIMLSRSSILASHLNNVIYSGYIPITWNALKILPYYNLSNANYGVSYISNDIGGSINGIEDSDLYLRSLQLGVFSPILRFNTENGKYFKREPWKWDLVTNNIATDYLRLRHRLIPYIYSEIYNYHKNGKALIEPFYYQNINCYDNENYVNQYYFGSAFLIAPIVKPMDEVINRTIQRFYLSKGVWYDFKTGKKFQGEKKYVSFYRNEDYPVFVKQGSVIPLAGEESYMQTSNPTNLEIHIFPGQSNTYQLYEDDGITNNYKNGEYCITELDYNYRASNYTFVMRHVEGNLDLIPSKRNYKIVFRNTKQADNVIAYQNDIEIKNIETETTENDFIVKLKDIDSDKQLTINCYGKDIEIDSLRLIKDDIDSILYDLKIQTILKSEIANIVFDDSLPSNKKRIALKKLKRKGLDLRSIKIFQKLVEYMEM